MAHLDPVLVKRIHRLRMLILKHRSAGRPGSYQIMRDGTTLAKAIAEVEDYEKRVKPASFRRHEIGQSQQPINHFKEAATAITSPSVQPTAHPPLSEGPPETVAVAAATIIPPTISPESIPDTVPMAIPPSPTDHPTDQEGSEGSGPPSPPPATPHSSPDHHHATPAPSQPSPGPTPGAAINLAPGPLATMGGQIYRGLLTYLSNEAETLGAPIRFPPETIEALGKMAELELARFDSVCSQRQMVIGAPVILLGQNLVVKTIKKRKEKEAKVIPFPQGGVGSPAVEQKQPASVTPIDEARPVTNRGDGMSYPSIGELVNFD